MSLPPGIQTDFDKVKVVINIEPASKVRPLRRQVLSILGNKKNVNQELPFVDAVISGPPQIIDKIQADDFKVFYRIL